MNIQFATCTRNKALEFLRRVVTWKDVQDTPESAGPLLDFVERDVVRVQDPMMYGKRIGIVSGNNWTDDPETLKAIRAAGMAMQEGQD